MGDLYVGDIPDEAFKFADEKAKRVQEEEERMRELRERRKQYEKEIEERNELFKFHRAVAEEQRRREMMERIGILTGGRVSVSRDDSSDEEKQDKSYLGLTTEVASLRSEVKKLLSEIKILKANMKSQEQIIDELKDSVQKSKDLAEILPLVRIAIANLSSQDYQEILAKLTKIEKSQKSTTKEVARLSDEVKKRHLKKSRTEESDSDSSGSGLSPAGLMRALDETTKDIDLIMEK